MSVNQFIAQSIFLGSYKHFISLHVKQNLRDSWLCVFIVGLMRIGLPEAVQDKDLIGYSWWADFVGSGAGWGEFLCGHEVCLVILPYLPGYICVNHFSKVGHF